MQRSEFRAKSNVLEATSDERRATARLRGSRNRDFCSTPIELFIFSWRNLGDGAVGISGTGQVATGIEVE